MPAAKLTIYTASAGSGKTYTLAREYLKLLLGSTDLYYFRKILAVTFTNDAANEMKSRVLEYLQIIAKNDGNAPMAAEILEQLQTIDQQLNSQTLAQRAQQIHEQIIHEYADFSIQTIDSFINRIITSFAYPLGLSGGFEVVLDSAELLQPATENILASIGNGLAPFLTQNIIDFQTENASNGKNWNKLLPDLITFAKILHSDKNLNAVSKIKALKQETILDIKLKISQKLAENEKNLKGIAQKFVDICHQNDLKKEDFTGGNTNSLLKILYGALDGKNLFEKFSDAVIENLAKPTMHSSKANKNVKALISNIENNLRDLIDQFQEMQGEFRNFQYLYQNIYDKLTQLSLLKNIQQELDNLMASTGQIHISEFNKLIFNEVINSPLPFIYERIGVKYQHILIDEFQDTSSIQFQNFLPIINNCLASGGNCLMVGDPKQGIYSFRGGDYRQLTYLNKKQFKKFVEKFEYDDVLEQHLTELIPKIEFKTLSTNYRSVAEIVKFNNDFFGFYSKNNTLNERVPILNDVFDDGLIQSIGNTKFKNGHVEIEFVDTEIQLEDANDEDSETDYSDYTSIEFLVKIEEKIKEILAENFELGDIAVLCRSNVNAKKVAFYLSQKKYEVISSDSVLIANSNVIQLLDVFLKWKLLDNPINRFQCISLFHLHILKNNLPNTIHANSDIIQKTSSDSFVEYFNNQGFSINTLLQNINSIYDFSQKIVECFSLFTLNEDDYIFAFLDQILKFELKNGANLGNFIDNWEQNKTKWFIVANRPNAIVVTTLHKAKGLQYPVVILPFAQWSFKNRWDETIWLDSTNLPYNDILHSETQQQNMDVALVNYNAKLKFEGVESQIVEAEQALFIEAINMLYVALTRPEQRLYILSKINKNWNGEIAKFEAINSLFYNYLINKKIFSKDINKYIIAQGAQKTETNKTKNTSTLNIDLQDFKIEAGPKLRVKNSFSSFEIDFGNLLHDLLAQITDASQINSAVEKISIQKNLQKETTTKIKDTVESLVNHATLKEYFAKNVKAKNEVEIIAKGKIYRADRLVFFADKTIIIDYKTGQAAEEHQKQIKQYAQILSEIAYPNIKMFLVYISDLQVVEVL